MSDHEFSASYWSRQHASPRPECITVPVFGNDDDPYRDGDDACVPYTYYNACNDKLYVLLRRTLTLFGGDWCEYLHVTRTKQE